MGAWLGGIARPAFGKRGDFRGKGGYVHEVGVEAALDNVLEFLASFVVRIGEGLQKFGVAPGAADILGRPAAGSVEETRIGGSGFGIGDAPQPNDMVPAVAEVVKVVNGLERRCPR